MIKKIIELSKKYWLFILLGAILAILSVLFSVKKPTLPTFPKPAPIPTPVSGQLPPPESNFTQILTQKATYKILLSEEDFAQIPSILPVYKIKIFTKEEIIFKFDQIIKEFGFTTQPEKKQIKNNLFLFWQEKENSLNINAFSGQFSFSGRFALTPATSKEKLTSDQIQELAQQKLVSWQLISEKPKPSEIKGFNVAGFQLVPTNNLKQAEVFQVIFNPEIDSYPIIGLGPATNLIEVKITHQGTLVSLFFNLHQIDQKPIDYYPLKTLKETKNQLEQGKGKIIQVFTFKKEERSIPSIDQIQEVQINQFKIVYYETVELQKYYQPIFLFDGQLTLKNGEVLKASFFLPAVAGEWLTPEP